MSLDRILAEAKKKMHASLETLKKELATVRTGRANASLLDTVQVEYYGAVVPLNQMGTVTVPDPSMLQIQPFDQSAIKAIETGILFPLALLWLGAGALASRPVMGTSGGQTGLLLLAGVVSTTPLLLFTAAARRLQYSTLGMLQFLAPTLQFIIAVAYGEPLRTAHFIAFPAIWIALALYVTALLRAPRLPQPPE